MMQKMMMALTGPFFCLIVFQWLPAQGANYVETLYCSVLGKEDASCKYKDIIHEALQAFGIEEFEGVPIKKMGKLPLRLIGNGYISFTMDGIWLNEERLSECPESEVIFILFHETAHYVHRDHGKQIISLIPAAWVFYTIPNWSIGIVDVQHLWARLGCAGAAYLATIWLLDHLFMRPIARYLDKNAELAATRVLCSINKAYIVQAHIDYLKLLLESGAGAHAIWSHSLQNRIDYVTAYYNELTQNAKEAAACQ